MAHKDLSDLERSVLHVHVQCIVLYLEHKGASKGLAREFIINAFDAEAAQIEKEATDAKDQA